MVTAESTPSSATTQSSICASLPTTTINLFRFLTLPPFPAFYCQTQGSKKDVLPYPGVRPLSILATVSSLLGIGFGRSSRCIKDFKMTLDKSLLLGVARERNCSAGLRRHHSLWTHSEPVFARIYFNSEGTLCFASTCLSQSSGHLTDTSSVLQAFRRRRELQPGVQNTSLGRLAVISCTSSLHHINSPNDLVLYPLSIVGF
ncbi:hypothetical protein DFS33DRAFT_130501 [Desarmillaria ectypa]|nr:hypothetical protein DFS33DRAFT_130501 [Desarmillaria ectypa]